MPACWVSFRYLSDSGASLIASQSSVEAPDCLAMDGACRYLRCSMFPIWICWSGKLDREEPRVTFSPGSRNEDEAEGYFVADAKEYEFKIARAESPGRKRGRSGGACRRAPARKMPRGSTRSRRKTIRSPRRRRSCSHQCRGRELDWVELLESGNCQMSCTCQWARRCSVGSTQCVRANPIAAQTAATWAALHCSGVAFGLSG